MAKQTVSDKETRCYHCGDRCVFGAVKKDQKDFCCSGCASVYEILKQGNLCSYYDLNEKPGFKQEGTVDYEKYAFLDDDKVAQQMVQFKDESSSHVHLYLPQIHCSSCLWLLEHLPQLHSAILAAEVDFAQREIFIVFDHNKLSLKELVTLLGRIGYEPQLNKGTIATGNQVKRSLTDQNIKYLGVAFASFVAVMMLSLPEYISGGELFSADLTIFFRWANLFLCLPAVFYSAQIFYTSAWKGLKFKVLNIDAPVALAIGITFLRTIYEVVWHHQAGFADSLTGLIFFMLLGRVLQQRTYRLINYERDFTSYFPIAVSKQNKDGSTETIKLEDIKFSDEILVYANDIIPVDGIIVKGTAEIDYSFVTGESTPSYKETSDIIYAGGKVLNDKVVVYALKEASQSYLTRLWNNSSDEKKGVATLKFTDQLSHYFTWGVLGISVLTAIFWAIVNPINILNAATAVLIISCPCALLLSETFTKGNILRNLSKIGLFVKNENVLDQLAKTNHIIFDKTGTLTEAKNYNTFYKGKSLSDAEKQLIYSVVSTSRHPYSKAIAQYIDFPQGIEGIQVKEIPGSGIEAYYAQQYVRIGSEAFVYGKGGEQKEGAEVYVMMDMELLGVFSFKNYYREHMESTLQKLSTAYQLSVLSGDNNAEYINLRSMLGAKAQILFNQKPNDKRAYLRQLKEQNQHTLMIGDGLNDNGALQESDCGLIICEQSNSFFPGGDALMDAKSIVKVDRILKVVKAVKPIIYFTFALSLLYNLVGLFFAVQGLLSPLIAAILMPASSITIILLTYSLSEWVSKRTL